MTDVTINSASEPSTRETVVDQIVSAVGEHTLDTVPPTSTPNIQPAIPISPSSPADDDFIPSCITQAPIPKALSNAKNKDLGAIMLGLAHECPRWMPGSVLKWVVMKEGFKTPADADYAAQHLNMACLKWNELNVGVTFEWVSNVVDATFALFHGGSHGNTLASAFFPNPNDISMMLVYNAAFSIPRWKANMWKMFMHELGHVLGLRHEFAMDTATGEKREMFAAVQLGPPNDRSVMTYGREPPEVQESDVESTRKFYALEDGAMMGLTPVQDYSPM
ncbi:matrix metalloproteinase-11 [Colletotrichum asianum]|uniref:Matrix metalloproteinase-11 n=1 Tax=Colletotrichum asianum TaxID=702518 RepID=A0A8H3WIN7_9PEZI|nr:matrix metalloproteinase-11 [Colletotrichum asianum]